ncbi:endoribonuclease [Lithospermum erythrorhizon]|uniref:non-specific serine/threonine protein kinase n=1 Tax=Lithospermum erythrorhizon TaxID=34254 RepID=A0AAV3NRB7_LITER
MKIRKSDSVIVAAPDGTIYLVDRNSGNAAWSFATGVPIYSSYQALPSQDNELTSPAEGDNFYVDCGEDWELYIHGNGIKKKLPLTAEEFISRTPYVSAGGGVVLSSKKTTVFLVDAKNGKVIQTFRSDNLSHTENRDAEKNPILSKEFGPYVGYTGKESNAVDKPLYVMRTDYSLKHTSSRTGKLLWYLKFADIEASFQCDGIEKFFDENSADGADLKMPLDCHIRPIVYRIRDRGSLESLFMAGGLLKSLPGNSVLPLPAPHRPGIVEPLDKLLGLYKDGLVLALPTTEVANSRILSLPGIDVGHTDVNVDSHAFSMPQVWPSVFLSIFLMLMATLFSYINRKWYKKGEDAKSQAITPKKKKPRKASAKSNDNVNETQKYAQNDKMARATYGLSGLEETDRNLHLTFSSGSGGGSDGRKIGKLVILNKVIAKGSNGTVVLEGIYDGRPVAVKRLVQTHHDVALKEIQNLIASDQHPNIVRWYGVEYDVDFVYLALERCTCSLDELISSNSHPFQDQNAKVHDSVSECTLKIRYMDKDDKNLNLWKANGYPSPQLLKLMRDIVSGLAHLHELGIIHRDLKPQNVLVIKERSICAKLSDMGISKRLPGNMSALSKQTTGYGSSGWQAPEQLRGERQTRAVDLFSLGCLLFYCMTGGEHPFGGIWERDGNIFRNKQDLFLIESFPEATDLISHLLDPKPELRPKIQEILCHPFFWNPEMRLSFLRDASDRVELEDRATTSSELLKAVESIGTTSFGSRWDDKIDSCVVNDLGRYRRYKFDSVRDLLRVIRNKLNHYRELSNEIQEVLGQVPEGFDSYFSNRFPNLLVEVYKVMHRYCAEEDNFLRYFVYSQV